MRQRPKLFNNGSIKDDYVNFDDEIDELDSKFKAPGPGQYDTANTTFAVTRTGDETSQKGMGGTERWRYNGEKDSSPGPGHYKPREARSVLG